MNITRFFVCTGHKTESCKLLVILRWCLLWLFFLCLVYICIYMLIIHLILTCILFFNIMFLCIWYIIVVSYEIIMFVLFLASRFIHVMSIAIQFHKLTLYLFVFINFKEQSFTVESQMTISYTVIRQSIISNKSF